MDVTINHNKFQVIYMHPHKISITSHSIQTTLNQALLILDFVWLGSQLMDPFQFVRPP